MVEALHELLSLVLSFPARMAANCVNITLQVSASYPVADCIVNFILESSDAGSIALHHRYAEMNWRKQRQKQTQMQPPQRWMLYLKR